MRCNLSRLNPVTKVAVPQMQRILVAPKPLLPCNLELNSSGNSVAFPRSQALPDPAAQCRGTFHRDQPKKI